MSTKKVTVSVLAEISGVSRATISRVLNNNPGVNEEIRQKVLKAIEETGYKRPVGKLANNEQTLPFTKITVISDDTTLLGGNYFYEPIMQGIKEEACRQGLSLEFHINSNLKDRQSYDDVLKNAEAVIAMGTDRKELIESVLSHKINAVMINGIDPYMRISSVLPDNEFGAFMITDYLLNKGHRKIKLLTANIKHSTYQRTEGFARAFAMHHLPFSLENNVIDMGLLAKYVDPSGKLEKTMYEGRAAIDFGASHFFDFLIENGYFKDTTAVFCICDTVAIGLISKLKEHGIAVPDDLSVVGFDDITLSSMLNPSLTTVRSNATDLVPLAFRTLREQALGEREKSIRIYQSVSLVERNSVKELLHD